MTRFGPDCLGDALAHLRPSDHCWVAYSGGLDSTVLLHAACSICGRLPGELRAIHIDHGLHADSSLWSAHCARQCDALGVPLVIRCLRLQPLPGESIEAMARQSRYRALAALLAPGDCVLTAHNQDDQAETLLLALLRGSGVQGLAAMPSETVLGQGRLLRPLLDVPRLALEHYARHQGLSWIEDPSNRAQRQDRNYLRHRVVPLLRARWPAVSATLARSAGHCAESARLVEAVASDALAGSAGRCGGTLSIQALAKLDRGRQRSALRLWLRRRGFAIPQTRHLARILDELLRARPDADPLVSWAGCEVRRYRDDLFALPPLPPSPGALAIRWEPDSAFAGLDLPLGLGSLQWPEMADGRRRDPWSAGALTVRFGLTGQTCRPRLAAHRRALKKLLQEAGIPRWLRPYVPLVLSGERLIAVAGVCGCGHEGSGPGPIESPRWRGHPWEELGVFAC